ncbi:MAG: hypothetical protein HY547_09290 [Elusimicrobia bacterium]|nr:hypothetical protein [Elusimicrobiota bacterium]
MPSKRRKDKDQDKKDRLLPAHAHGQAAATGEKVALLTTRQWKWVAVGAAVTAAGFAVLSQSDPSGKNWAGHLSPLMILGGYAVIGIVLWTADCSS